MSDHHHVPSSLNPDFHIQGKKEKDISYYLDGINNGNRYILSEAITLIESTIPAKRELALNILQIIPKKEQTFRIGITGSPGVGKSTFIEAFGLYLIERGHKVAVLAIDPSSQLNKGSILGDKTRMQELSSHPQAYVRPTASGAILGGTAAATKEAINLCEAAGFDMIIIETVGVGQSEIEVDFVTDVNLLLLQPGAGDDLQGIKRGVVENADIFIINKADGTQLDLAKQTKIAYKNAIQLFHHQIVEWTSPVLLTSAINHTGLDAVYQKVIDFQKLLIASELLETTRRQQELRWFEKQIIEKIKKMVFEHNNVQSAFEDLSNGILTNDLNTSTALHEMNKILRSIIQTNS